LQIAPLAGRVVTFEILVAMRITSRGWVLVDACDPLPEPAHIEPELADFRRLVVGTRLGGAGLGRAGLHGRHRAAGGERRGARSCWTIGRILRPARARWSR